MTHSIDSAVDVPASTSILTTPVISLESKSKESVLEETVNESGTEGSHETTDNEENHDLLFEMARLPDENSQLLKELQGVQEGQRETVEAKAQTLQAQITAPQAEKKTAVGIAVHFEDGAKVTTPTRKRRELDDFDDSERKEKRAKHVNEENERGASTPTRLTFQDTVGTEDIDYGRPPSPKSPTTSASMASANTKPLSDKPKAKKLSLMKKITRSFSRPRPHSTASHLLTPPETPTRPAHKQHSQATSQFERAAKVATDGHKLLSKKYKAARGQKEPRKPSPRPGMPSTHSLFS